MGARNQAVAGLLSKTVPVWTVLLGIVIVFAMLPWILVLGSSPAACADEASVIADRHHPNNQLTIGQGSIIKVAVPKDAAPPFSFPEVASTNYGVLAISQAPCRVQPNTDQASYFYFKAVAEGSARLETVAPASGRLFSLAWTPVVWDVTVRPDYTPLLIAGIEAAAAAGGIVFVVYRRRIGSGRHTA